MPQQPDAFESRFFSAPDGLKLHVRDYVPRSQGDRTRLPVVCLPGLARTSGDFDRLARALSGAAAGPRRIVVPDYRGRGLSERDRNPANYNLAVENADLLAVLDAAGVGEAVFVGTSRGGLHVLLLAAARPRILRGAVLNDIGPVIERTGLARLRAYIGKLPRPASWPEAGDLLRRAVGGFSAVSAAEWDEYVRLTYEEKDGMFVTRYDPALAKSLESIDIEAPLPALWPQFAALGDIPLLAIRGANSDMLSPATLAEMARRHPDCKTYVVEGQGHAPLLSDEATIARIAAFADKADARERLGEPAERAASA
jgi:pimeloyl-ACP methyl ester carboxylesterase